MIELEIYKDLIFKKGVISIYKNNKNNCIDLEIDNNYEIASIRIDKEEIEELIKVLNEVIKWGY